MSSLDAVSDIVAEAIAGIEYPAAPKGLYAPIEYTLDSGGKRLRPQLVLASCLSLGGTADDALPAAMGIEIFHNFTLLHDDVMDSADLRRGRLTVHKRWNDNTAILSGDAMLTMAVQYVAGTPVAAMPQVMALFNRTAMEVYEGQQYDMDFEQTDDVTVGQYLEMIRLKTSVLIGCACKCGAMIAGVTDDEAQAMYEYGVNLGMAFQLRDDWLDTYGDPLVFGKRIGGDIVNAKKTWLLINALAERRDEVTAILGEDLDDDERIRQITAVYDALRLNERCNALIKQYADKAIASLKLTHLEGEGLQYFIFLAEKSVARDY